MAAALKSGAALWRDDGQAPRPHLYRFIHKGLRGLMTDTLLKVGRMDVADDCERAEVIEQLRMLLMMCTRHLHHEDTVVHPAIERAEAGRSMQTANEHVGHAVAIRTLEQQVLQFESAAPARRAVLAHELYLDLGNFVAENLEHMMVEETENHAVLVRNYSDEELFGIEAAVKAQLTPQESQLAMLWMLPHVNAAERALMFTGMKRAAPPEVFNGMMALAGEVLNQRDLYKLQKALA